MHRLYLKQQKPVSNGGIFCIFDPMKHTYYPQGTCSQVIEFEIVDGKIHNV